MTPLGQRIDIVEQLLADAERACGTYADDPGNWHAKHRVEMDRVRAVLVHEHGARVNDRWDGASVSFGRIRAGSTSGLAGALRNWLKAARSREAAP